MRIIRNKVAIATSTFRSNVIGLANDDKQFIRIYFFTNIIYT